MSESGPFPVKHPWRSLTSVLIVQAQNAFNDNFLKIILIALAGAIAKGTWVGDNAQRLLSAFIPLAFILFSPVAGYLSDRHSKRNVLFWCVVAQLAIVATTLVALKVHILWLGIFCFFMLSVQSTFFSPAKQGILKELVGSKKLTFANGLMQMLTMLAILGGMILGGNWFGNLTKAGKDYWDAALIPIFVISIVACIPMLIKMVVDPTPANISSRFELSLMWKHFTYLKDLFTGKAMKHASVGIAYYWLIASFVGVILFDFGNQMHPGSTTKQAFEYTRIFGMIGGGLMVGSILVSLISRNGFILGLVPIGGYGLALGVLGSGALPPGSIGFYASFVIIGFFGGFFLVPLSSFLQDIAPNEKRGRIMSAVAMLTSLTGLLAIGISTIFTQMGLKLSFQMLFFVIPTVLVTWYVSSLIKIQKELPVSDN